MNKYLLKFSAFTGLVSLFLSIPLGLLELGYGPAGVLLLLFVSISVLSFIFFMIGFIHLGNIQKNLLLVVSSYFLLFIGVIDEIIIYLSLVNANWTEIHDSTIFEVTSVLVFGLVGMIHGYSLLNLKNNIREIAKKTGWLEVVFYFSLFTIILSPLALLLFVPMMVFEITLLLKASKLSWNP